MKIDYIIVQAGGKGKRLLPLTYNRPKALVPINNRPIIFHLFEKFPNTNFIVIGDYKFNVLKSYFDNFAKNRLITIRSYGEGNASGIQEALKLIPDDKAFLIVWSDLYLDSNIDLKSIPNGNYIGITNKFSCSWKFENNIFSKEKTNSNGLGGYFIFENKKHLLGLPQSGSFAQWLSQEKNINFQTIDLLNTKELGTLESLRAADHSNQNRCRPYNKMTFYDDKVKKEGLTPDGKKLIEREVEWYKAVSKEGFLAIPKIYSFEPLIMSKIDGENIFKAELTDEQKEQTLRKIVENLNSLHKINKSPINVFDMQEDYYSKTMRRLYSISSCIPFANEKNITINNRICENILVHPEKLQNLVDSILCEPVDFGIIHGDGTLTNTMIDRQGNVYFIDARGYFGKTPLVGDVYYDWAKLYYSVAGAFDQFNIKNFELRISEKDVSYKIANSGWEHLTEYMLSLISNCDLHRIKLIHAIIWLSLASHCWEDYDSMCLAFYNGLYLLNELM